MLEETGESTAATVEVAGEAEESAAGETKEQTTEEINNQPLTAKEWIDTLDFTEMKLLVFNPNGEMLIIDDGGEYQMVEGDELYIYKPIDFEGITTNGDMYVLEAYSQYYKMGTMFEGTEEIKIRNSDNSDYSITFTLTTQ